MTRSAPASLPTSSAKTLAQLILARFDQSADDLAIVFQRNGQLVRRTWNELANDVFCTVHGLVQRGVQSADRVAQLSENRYEWIVVDLAIQLSQAIHVPIHAPLAAEQVGYQINHSNSQVVFVSDRAQAAKVQRIASSLDKPPRVIAFEPDATNDGDSTELQIEPFTTWLDAEPSQKSPEPSNDHRSQAGRRLASEAVESLVPESLATILYTSGTTGAPKGVVLTQDNFLSNVVGTVETFGTAQTDVRLTFLPLSHIFARTCDLYTWIVGGCQLCLATSRDTVVGDCQWAQPTQLSGVPYFFDRLRRHLVEQGQAKQPGALRRLLGGSIHHCASGGAALPDHVFDYYQEQGVPILQGYGLTETSPVISISSPSAYRRSASGQPLPGVKVRIAEDGEIISRGRHIMKGYWNDPEATREAIVDGWFHTGDLGKTDEDGFLYITGRKKELIVTAAGKNVAPVLLESLLTEDPVIDQALVIGDGRSFLTALIVPNWRAVRVQLPDLPPEIESDDQPSTQAAREGLNDHEAVVQLLKCRIEQRLNCVSYHEQVRKFVLLSEPFSIERGEMTPKLSLRRPIIQQHYADQIDAMYRK